MSLNNQNFNSFIGYECQSITVIRAILRTDIFYFACFTFFTRKYQTVPSMDAEKLQVPQRDRSRSNSLGKTESPTQKNPDILESVRRNSMVLISSIKTSLTPKRKDKTHEKKGITIKKSEKVMDVLKQQSSRKSSLKEKERELVFFEDVTPISWRTGTVTKDGHVQEEMEKRSALYVSKKREILKGKQ